MDPLSVAALGICVASIAFLTYDGKDGLEGGLLN